MSGICGVWAFDGGEPALDPILAELERRGPDGTHSWADGPVALGHTLLATTPEALVEVLPLTEPDSGCTITADARIDNCEELIAALDLGGETRTIGDGELILRAYLEWGEDCPTHLLGDFAFAIWDPREQRLFCARDHMGMRQLIYHHQPGKLFAFATEADALVADVGVPKRLNEARIADFLDNLEGVDLTSTFFNDVFRLPPAHNMTVSLDGLSIGRYWELTLGPELKLDSDQAYEAAFFDVFTQAVRCRLRSAGPVGSMLSGGIDSNSVSAVAASLLEAQGRDRLMTFSGISSDATTGAETRAIRVAAANPKLSAKLIDHARLEGMLDDLPLMTKACAEPFDAPMTLHRAIYLDGHRSGTKIMLDGVGGDLVLNAGNVVAELLYNGQFGQALTESAWRKRSFRHAVAAAKELLSAFWAITVPLAVRNVRRRILWRLEDRRIGNGRSLINDQFSRKIDLGARRNHYRSSFHAGLPFGRKYRVNCILHPHLVVGRERYDRVASAVAIEPRDPFLDLRMIEFCLSLPRDQLHSNRFTKSILRRAMVGTVPAEVMWQRSKEHVGWQFTQAIFPYLLDPELACETQLLGNFINFAALRELGRNSTIGMDRLRWFEICVLAYWLSRYVSLERSVANLGE